MLKKIVYFLLACEEKPAILFLKQHNFSYKKNKALPLSFIKKSKKAFEKNKEKILSEESLLFPWKKFCKNSSYEAVLSVILCGVLKHPIDKASWFLKIKPEDISYRLTEGLILLSDELGETSLSFLSSSEGKTSKPVKDQKDLNKKELKALKYSDFLSKKALPDNLEKMSFFKKKLSSRYLLFIFIFFVLCIFCVMIFFLLLPSSSIILYQSP